MSEGCLLSHPKAMANASFKDQLILVGSDADLDENSSCGRSACVTDGPGGFLRLSLSNTLNEDQHQWPTSPIMSSNIWI